MNVRVIDHQQAIKNMMAERYLLSELTESELDAFEGHMFDCAVCFEQVRAGTEFVSYLKRIGAEEPATAAAQPRWRQLLGHIRPAPGFAFAACLLAGISVYQNLITIQMLKAPQIESRYMLTEASRAAANVIAVPRNSRIRLAIEYTAEKQYASYEAQIVSEDGKSKLVMPVSVSRSQDTIELSVYAGDLKPGKNFMLILATDQDGTRQELARDLFILRFQD